jgi:hypothetical protein
MTSWWPPFAGGACLGLRQRAPPSNGGRRVMRGEGLPREGVQSDGLSAQALVAATGVVAGEPFLHSAPRRVLLLALSVGRRTVRRHLKRPLVDDGGVHGTETMRVSSTWCGAGHHQASCRCRERPLGGDGDAHGMAAVRLVIHVLPALNTVIFPEP